MPTSKPEKKKPRKPLSVTHPELAKESDGWDPFTVLAGSHRKVKWNCALGHHWEAVVKSRALGGSSCPYCSGRKILVGINDLATTHPDLAKEADGWDPTTFAAGSNKKVKWNCVLGHKWDAVIASRSTRGYGCSYCSGRKVLIGFNDLATTHPELAKEAYGWDPSSLTARSVLKKDWICKFGHHWNSVVYSRKNGHGCSICDGKKVLVGFNDLASTNPEIAKQAFNWDPTLLTAGSNRKREWICENHHSWIATIKSRKRGNGCPVCSGNVVKQGSNDLETLEPELAKQAFGWDPKTVTRSSSTIKEWKCVFGHQWRAAVAARSGGTGCPVCDGKKVLFGFNDLQTLEPEIAKQANGWDPRLVTRQSGAKKSWKCELGHFWDARVASRTNGSGCIVCTNQKVLMGFNDLATTHPELSKEAYGWDPTTVVAGSHKKVKWICALGHNWDAAITSRAGRESACPYCANQKVLMGFNDLATTHPDLSKQAYGWNPKILIAGTHKKVKWKCSESHTWIASIASRSSLSNQRGCPTCAKTGFDPNKDGYFYFLSNTKWEMLQIGITNVPDDRLIRHKKTGWEALELRGPMDGHLTRQWETAILRMLKAKGADLSNEKIAGKFDGYSEAWTKASFPVDSIKELMRLTDEFEEGLGKGRRVE